MNISVRVTFYFYFCIYWGFFFFSMMERIFAVLTGKGRLVRMSREETGEEIERNEQITFYH